MNRCNANFIEKNEIDLSKINTRIYCTRDINWIAKEYEVQGKSSTSEICIEDLIGFYDSDSKPMRYPDALDYFFDDQGDTYHRRAVSMLDYNSQNVVDGLLRSFKVEPISILEVDNNKSVILTNGMHRFLILRLLYLNAKANCKTEEELEELKRKFTIPVKKTPIDLCKTYCKFLIDTFQPVNLISQHVGQYKESENSTEENKEYVAERYVGWSKKYNIYLSESELEQYKASVTSLSQERTDDFELTGRTVIRTYGGEEYRLTNEELIEFVRNVIKNSNKSIDNMMRSYFASELSVGINELESLRDFINVYFQEELKIEYDGSRYLIGDGLNLEDEPEAIFSI